MTIRSRLTRATARLAVTLLVAAAAAAPAGTARAAQPGDWWHSQWQLDQVWQLTDGSGVTVAVLDTGVDASLPELAGAVLPGVDLLGGAPDGRTDHDPQGHGTGMALMISGNGEGTDLPGVAPGATILPVTTTVGIPAGTQMDIRHMEAIRYAVDSGAHVINMSTGAISGAQPGTTCPPEVADAVRYAVANGVVVVASSGNLPGGQTHYPASCPGVLVVGATDQQGEPWEFTHRSEQVHLAAPGVSISRTGPDGQILTRHGTSISSALVSGVVALLRAQFPEASAHELVTRLLVTAQDAGEPGRDDATGYGIVQPLAALTATVPPDAPNPVYDPLGDLTDVPPPTVAPEVGPPDRPVSAPVPADDGGGTPLPVVLAVAVVLLVGAAGAFALLGLRARRRRDPGDGDG